MPIVSLDTELCNGCKICVDVCTEDVLRLNKATRKAVIAYPEDCVACFACEGLCPLNIIEVTKDRARELPLPY
ncbi:MAG: ferredoxin family protein [Chloroflexi bacterium]|nr:ferredoxin family protein [Chloroflexota bacterium]